MANFIDNTNKELHNNAHNIKLICLIFGIPSSGKSTFIRNFIKYLTLINSDLNIILIEFDTVLPKDTRCSEYEKNIDDKFEWKVYRENLRHRIDSFLSGNNTNIIDIFTKTYPQVSTELDQIFRTHNELSNNNLKNILMMDDTFHYRSMRYEFYQMAKKHNIDYSQIFIECDKFRALERNKHRVNNIPDQTIINIHNQLSKPDKYCFKWETNTIIINSEDQEFNNVTYKNIHSRLMDIIGNNNNFGIICKTNCEEIKEKIKSKIDTKESFMHQADIILRNIVGDNMKSLKETNNNRIIEERLKLCAHNYNLCKKEILKSLHSNPEFEISTFKDINKEELIILLTNLMTNAFLLYK